MVKQKRTIGTQFIRAIDSIGANMAEGFGKYHYLDKNRFNYNARGSLLESIYWVDLLYQRGIINNKEHKDFYLKLEKLHIKLNNYIKITKSQFT
jgi:four helix bundle protein